MRSLLGTTAFLIASAALPVMASPQIHGGNGGYYDGMVRCESNDGRTRQCALDTRGGVQLVRQLSNAACVEGQTWGISRGGVWVSQGCRGEFRALSDGYDGGQGNPYGYGGGGYGNSGGGYGNGYGNTYGNTYGNGNGNAYGQGQVIRCESNDGRTQRCALHANPRSVQLVRQLSRTACVQGRTWGHDRGGIWVSQGCRGEFMASGSSNRYSGGGYNNGYGNGYGNGQYNGYGSGGYGSGGYGSGGYGSSGQMIRCESNDGRTRECAANTRAGVQLVRQLSNAACIQGQTWGYGRNSVWVSQGCRAEFRTY